MNELIDRTKLCLQNYNKLLSSYASTTTSDSYPPRPLPRRKTKKPIGSFHGAEPRNSSFIYLHNHWHHINTLHASLLTPLTTSWRIDPLPVNFLIDTGSSLTLINDCLFRKLPSYLTRFRRRPPSTIALRLPNNSSLHIQWTLSLPITLKQTTRWATVYVVRDLWRPCVLGNNFICQHNLQIDGGKQTVFFPNPRRQYFLLNRSLTTPPNTNRSIQHIVHPFQLALQTFSPFQLIANLLRSI